MERTINSSHSETEREEGPVETIKPLDYFTRMSGAYAHAYRIRVPLTTSDHNMDLRLPVRNTLLRWRGSGNGYERADVCMTKENRPKFTEKVTLEGFREKIG